MQSSCSSAPFTATRIPVFPHPCPGNAGIRCRYPIDAAAWIWAPPPKTEQEIQLVTFQLEFTLEEDRTLCFDVSADQHYLLRANGQEFGRGPDRAEAGGWSFHRYELRLTTVEDPEPSRSDCHGWGSHPLYHSLTGLAGIRPGTPGFARVEIRPCPGPLNDLDAAVPHPGGEIRVRFRRENGAVQFDVHTPVPGTLHWRGETHPLQAGVENRITGP